MSPRQRIANRYWRYGMDWRRMVDSPGVLGNTEAIESVNYLCFPEGLFIYTRGRPDLVDVWLVRTDGLDVVDDTKNPFWVVHEPIGPAHLSLHETDIQPDLPAS